MRGRGMYGLMEGDVWIDGGGGGGGVKGIHL